MCSVADARRGWSARSRSARPVAPPVAQRMNSSRAASNDSVRDSTSSRSAFQDANPCSRATADWASCSARSEASISSTGMPVSDGRTANRRSAAGSRALAASSRDFACFFSCSRFGRAGNSRDGIQPPCFSPVVRRQAARRCNGRWSSSYDGGLGPSREPAGALSAHTITLFLAFARVNAGLHAGLRGHRRCQDFVGVNIYMAKNVCDS